ncbi:MULTISPECIES: DUF4920 domain-containing protein [Flavobacterium]|jgi:hypothetical protein|uniref:DUF4920 domain-containing protein n=1 Tax=Flavobacterium cupriresistens TaxID=2893885 RepID=A0ABU4RJF6_9FLAO|nr:MULTISPECIES: DUF4920 domain-containing protein [unclassified Flavobacterium]KLT71691.1 hypothetical protein AB674_01130 [Flavobacterium sp. ABG]MDX6190666.1 DUF4920 domain-containing protein [Flavobacterium sp. Fl-318]UFH44157.1 DUF4920 domain-containing protein [Flavobacterium sp. F-323]
MKPLLYSVLLSLCLSSLCFSQEAVEKKAPPAGNALVGDYYGANVSKVSEGKAISVEKLESGLKNTKKVENVAVKGLVTDVCEKRGCWLTIKTEDGSPFFVKMKEYAFFVPTSLKGKNVVLEGVAEKKITSVEELKHYAKDAKKAQSEIDAITAPKEEIRFLADGIRVVN